MAILIKDLFAVLPGKIYPETFSKGSVCPIELEDVARSLGYIEPDKPKVNRKAPSNKAISKVPEVK